MDLLKKIINDRENGNENASVDKSNQEMCGWIAKTNTRYICGKFYSIADKNN